ncbi:unnamed protein product, partial [Protopolystoma xenopodis]
MKMIPFALCQFFCARPCPFHAHCLRCLQPTRPIRLARLGCCPHLASATPHPVPQSPSLFDSPPPHTGSTFSSARPSVFHEDPLTVCPQKGPFGPLGLRYQPHPSPFHSDPEGASKWCPLRGRPLSCPLATVCPTMLAGCVSGASVCPFASSEEPFLEVSSKKCPFAEHTCRRVHTDRWTTRFFTALIVQLLFRHTHNHSPTVLIPVCPVRYASPHNWRQLLSPQQYNNLSSSPGECSTLAPAVPATSDRQCQKWANRLVKGQRRAPTTRRSHVVTDRGLSRVLER